jgi:hypothetical protein
MLVLQKFLRACYGYLAAIFLFASSFTVPSFLRDYRRDLHNAAMNPDLELWRAILAEGSQLVILLPVPLAIFFGLAWWTLRQGKPSGRFWAITASVVSILSGLPSAIVLTFVFLYRGQAPPTSFLLLSLLPPAIGIVGLIAFAPRHPQSIATVARPRPLRVQGDGTGRVFDAIAWGIAVVTGVWGVSWCQHWGYVHRLPLNPFGMFWVEFCAALLITTTLHELGHACVGTALGMKLRMFVVGPFHWRIHDGVWRFELKLTKLLSGGGATGLVTANPKQSKWIDIAMIAAGPSASLVTGLAFMALMFTAPGRIYVHGWELFGLCAILSLSAVLINLLPLRPESFYSDGAQIYQLISGGPWADFRQAISIAMATTITPLRPRDYDMAAIRRAEEHFVKGHHAFVLRLMATSHYMDIGDYPQAERSFAEAERLCQESALDPQPETLMAFVFRSAFLRRDAVAARAWWDRMETKKPAHLGVDYWLARSALLMAEGNIAEAVSAWQKGNALAQQLPPSGDHDFDRDRALMLRRAIDETPLRLAPGRAAILAPS